MSKDRCYYFCGPRYCSSSYSRDVEHIGEPALEDFKQKFKDIVYEIVQDKRAIDNILNNTIISSRYSPGTDKYLYKSDMGVYQGPGIWFEAEYIYDDRQEHIYIERNLEYCYLYDNSQDSVVFNYLDDEIDKQNIYQCYLVDDVDMVFYKLSKFRSKRLSNILKPYIKEFREDMNSMGETRV